MKTLRIDRAKWRCGAEGPHSHGNGETLLLNPEGFMCCLGFRCKLGGATVADLLETGRPALLPRHRPLALVDRDGNDTDFGSSAISINDDSTISKKVRERRLIKLASRYGERWEFVGSYAR